MEHDSQPEAYCVHVWIRGIHPMLWRRFLVRSDGTLADDMVGNNTPVVFVRDPMKFPDMFHDMGPIKKYSSATERFEVDGANAARDFLRQHSIDEASIDVVWDAIALHTTPGIPRHKKPEVALVTAGVDMDVHGLGYHDVPDVQREAVLKAHPRGDHFKEKIIQTFYDGFGYRPDTTFGTMNDDVIALLDPSSNEQTFVALY